MPRYSYTNTAKPLYPTLNRRRRKGPGSNLDSQKLQHDRDSKRPPAPPGKRKKPGQFAVKDPNASYGYRRPFEQTKEERVRTIGHANSRKRLAFLEKKGDNLNQKQVAKRNRLRERYGGDKPKNVLHSKMGGKGGGLIDPKVQRQIQRSGSQRDEQGKPTFNNPHRKGTRPVANTPGFGGGPSQGRISPSVEPGRRVRSGRRGSLVRPITRPTSTAGSTVGPNSGPGGRPTAGGRPTLSRPVQEPVGDPPEPGMGNSGGSSEPRPGMPNWQPSSVEELNQHRDSMTPWQRYQAQKRLLAAGNPGSGPTSTVGKTWGRRSDNQLPADEPNSGPDEMPTGQGNASGAPPVNTQPTSANTGPYSAPAPYQPPAPYTPPGVNVGTATSNTVPQQNPAGGNVYGQGQGGLMAPGAGPMSAPKPGAGPGFDDPRTNLYKPTTMMGGAGGGGMGVMGGGPQAQVAVDNWAPPGGGNPAPGGDPFSMMAMYNQMQQGHPGMQMHPPYQNPNSPVGAQAPPPMMMPYGMPWHGR